MEEIIKELNKQYHETRMCPVCKRKKTGGTPKRWRGASMFEKEEAIYNCLIQHPNGLMTTEIAKKIDMWYNFVSRIVDVMHVKGKVKFKPIGRGRLIKAVLKKIEQKERAKEFKEENKDELKTMASETKEETLEEEIIPIQETSKQVAEEPKQIEE